MAAHGVRNLPAILERIQERIAALKTNETAVSRKAGLGTDGIRNMRRARDRGVMEGGANIKTIQQLAPVLHTNVMWLLTGQGDMGPTRGAPEKVSVVGIVGAGALVYLFPEGPGEVDVVNAPPTATPETVAVRIEGDSLGPFFNGWYAFYDDRRDPPTDELIGRLCVCWLADGGAVIKRLRRGSMPGRWTLEAQFEPPIYDVVLASAAPVTDIGARVPE